MATLSTEMSEFNHCKSRRCRVDSLCSISLVVYQLSLRFADVVARSTPRFPQRQFPTQTMLLPWDASYLRQNSGPLQLQTGFSRVQPPDLEPIHTVAAPSSHLLQGHGNRKKEASLEAEVPSQLSRFAVQPWIPISTRYVHSMPETHHGLDCHKGSSTTANPWIQ